MVDFSISEVDEQILAQIKAEGKAGEKYTRYYEDNEEELIKDYYPEAEDFPPMMDLLKKRSFDDTPGATFQMLLGMQRAATLGVSLRTGKGGLGNAALAAAGTDEQKAKWGGLTLAMSITEPGAGSDTKAITTTARLMATNGSSMATKSLSPPAFAAKALLFGPRSIKPLVARASSPSSS